MNQIAATKTDAVAEKILDAALVRLSDYGLGKTTMAEIAEDCGMSAANLYRYYKNKNEIACACCARAMAEMMNELRKIVRDEGVSASDKLRNYAVRMVEINIEQSAGKCKVGELVANMTLHNPKLIHEKISAHNSLITEILSQGNASGEFSVDDVLATAELVYSSLVVFNVPLFADLFPLDQYKQSASGVADLLITGLGKT